MTFLKYGKLNSHRILVWLTEHINIVLFSVYMAFPWESVIYILLLLSLENIILQQKGKNAFGLFCFFTRQAGKNDIAFCVIKK